MKNVLFSFLTTIFLVSGLTAQKASSITHEQALKTEALNLAREIKTSSDYEQNYQFVSNCNGEKIDTMKITTSVKDGQIYRVSTMYQDEEKMEGLAFYYKDEKLIICFYIFKDLESGKGIFNTRYYDTEGKCKTSVCKSAFYKDNKGYEDLGESKFTKKRFKESERYLELAKAENWDNFCKEEISEASNRKSQ